MWPSKPPLTPYVGEAKEGLGGAENYSDLFLLLVLPFSFTGLCNSHFLPGTEGGRSLSCPHAFQLLNHQRGLPALPSYRITPLGPQFAARAWNSLQSLKIQTHLCTQMPVHKQTALPDFVKGLLPLSIVKKIYLATAEFTYVSSSPSSARHIKKNYKGKNKENSVLPGLSTMGPNKWKWTWKHLIWSL